jgi:membrane associated rhomboid family serine protease
MFVDLPSRAHRTRHWAAPALAIIAIAGYVAWLVAADPDAWLHRWGLQSGLAEGWRTLLVPARLATPFTSLFLHASAWHLVGNGLFLLIFGVPAERALGPWRLLALFLLGGALANTLAAFLLDAPGRVVVGASGGISAIIGAYLVLFPHARLGVVVPLGLWLEFVRAPAALLIGLWVVLQYLLTFAGPAVGAVAWWAHLGGFGAGVLMALAFRSAVRERKRGR